MSEFTVYKSKSGTKYNAGCVFADDDIIESVITFPVDSVIIRPTYNIFHVGASCHYASCIQLLCSCTKLLQNTNHEQLLNTLLLQYSHAPLHLKTMFELAKSIGIRYDIIQDADETMHKIFDYITSNDIWSRNLIFYYDFTDSYLQPDETKMEVSELVTSILPQYLILHLDMYSASMKNINKSGAVNVVSEFGEYKYMLSGYIAYVGMHLVYVMFNYNTKKAYIYDDLDDRYTPRITSIDVITKLKPILGLFVKLE